VARRRRPHTLSAVFILTTFIPQRVAQGKTVVSIMGGHGMPRSSDIYCNVTKLAWRLAREGFLMVTGARPTPSSSCFKANAWQRDDSPARTHTRHQ
jgi:hypothetical protein